MTLSKELKTVLITGGTRGVGLEIAKMFKNRDFNVVITGRDVNYSEKIATDLNNDYPSKGTVKGYKLDFTDLHKSSTLLNNLKNQIIKPTYLINNAGVLMLNNIENVTEKQMDTMFKVNTYGPILLSKLCKKNIWENKKGGILFNSPPYQIDEKTTHLMPYMQTKMAQTTFMKSLSNSIPYENHDIIISSFWTNYPLLTDAILKRGIGNKADCMHPYILAHTVEELLFNTNKRTQYNGKELIDEYFLKGKEIDISNYKMGPNVPKLDQLFMKHLLK